MGRQASLTPPSSQQPLGPTPQARWRAHQPHLKQSEGSPLSQDHLPQAVPPRDHLYHKTAFAMRQTSWMGPMDFLMDLTMGSARGNGPVIQVSSVGPLLKGPEAFW